MNLQEIKDRLKKAKPRIKNLFDKYPIVGGAVFLAGLCIGMIAGAVIW